MSSSTLLGTFGCELHLLWGGVYCKYACIFGYLSYYYWLTLLLYLGVVKLNSGITLDKILEADRLFMQHFTQACWRKEPLLLGWIDSRETGIWRLHDKSCRNWFEMPCTVAYRMGGIGECGSPYSSKIWSLRFFPKCHKMSQKGRFPALLRVS